MKDSKKPELTKRQTTALTILYCSKDVSPVPIEKLQIMAFMFSNYLRTWDNGEKLAPYNDWEPTEEGPWSKNLVEDFEYLKELDFAKVRDDGRVEG